MATRSFIAKYDTDANVYDAIYCHWDGYPSGVGVTLRDHYDTDLWAKMLVNIGDISSLRDGFEDTERESYKKRGDTDVDTKTFKYFSEMVEYYRNMSCEYGYVWEDGKWNCYALDPQEINLYEMEHADV